MYGGRLWRNIYTIEKRGKGSIFTAIISELMSAVIMWKGNELETTIMTPLPTELLSL